MKGPVVASKCCMPDSCARLVYQSYQKARWLIRFEALEDLFPFLPREEFWLTSIVDPCPNEGVDHRNANLFVSNGDGSRSRGWSVIGMAVARRQLMLSIRM